MGTHWDLNECQPTRVTSFQSTVRRRIPRFLCKHDGVAIPVVAGILHCAYFFGMFYLFPRTPLWVMLIPGFIYSVSISWNINGISHNFIHNPYFRSPLLNRWFSVMESITVGIRPGCASSAAGV